MNAAQLETGLGGAPKVGDAVVVRGVKYRIRGIVAGELAELVEAGPHWRAGAWILSVRLDWLAWDARVGVWRKRGA